MSVSPKFDKKNYKKVDVFSEKNTEGFRFYFEECSKNYSSFLNHYFVNKDGVLDGFRY